MSQSQQYSDAQPTHNDGEQPLSQSTSNLTMESCFPNSSVQQHQQQQPPQQQSTVRAETVASEEDNYSSSNATTTAFFLDNQASNGNNSYSFNEGIPSLTVSSNTENEDLVVSTTVDDEHLPVLRNMLSDSPSARVPSDTDKYYVRSSDTMAPPDLLASNSTDSYMKGGPMWRQACEEAIKYQNELDEQQENWVHKQHDNGENDTPPRRVGRFAAFATSSRAEPNATPPVKGGPMVRIVQDDDLLSDTGVAQQRVKVAQLLVLGLLGLFLGWMGNFLVAYSCHFATVDVSVGAYGSQFPLRYGLWKYSSIDSAMNGYKACYPYNSQHSLDAPVVPRLANLFALLSGTYSLLVLWGYLITGKTAPDYWIWAVRMAILAGVLQGSTLFFFVGHLCRSVACNMGPGSWWALITTLVWWIVAYELHYFTPSRQIEDDTVTVVSNLEMSDLQDASEAYMKRAFSDGSKKGYYEPPQLA